MGAKDSKPSCISYEDAVKRGMFQFIHRYDFDYFFHISIYFHAYLSHIFFKFFRKK